MKKRDIIKSAFVSSIIIAVYVVFVVMIITLVDQRIFQDSTRVLIPIFMLMFLVFSVAFMGFMIFGKPAMLYVDGKKKEALSLLGYTLEFLFILAVITLIITLLFV